MKAFKQWWIETKAYYYILISDTVKFLISLIFPLVAAAAIVLIASKDMYKYADPTKTGCFFITCAAIWGGLFNSIQIIASERANIKREMVNGLKPRCYTASRAVLQFVLCFLQSMMLTAAFVGMDRVSKGTMPKDGIIFGNTLIEFFIGVFLLMYATDMMGMFVSSLVKTVESGTAIAPYILIAQLIFSGAFLELKGVFKKISTVMLSRWGMESFGSTCRLNKMDLKIVTELPKGITLEKEADAMYKATAGHLWKVWIVLLVFIIVFIIGSNLAIHRVSKDTR